MNDFINKRYSFAICNQGRFGKAAEAVWDSDTLALLRSECNGIESEQGREKNNESAMDGWT